MMTSRRAPIWLDAQRPLAQWYASGLGQSILDQLDRSLATCLAGVFGFQGLQVGNPAPERDLLAHAGLHRRTVLDAPGLPADVSADVLNLPVARDTMKAVLFFHTLDFCGQPHQALREADRVLMSDGHLIIVGFNPLSAFGARHLLTGWRQCAPWNGRFYSRMRVTDWLSVLDYRVQHSEATFIRPPINSPRLLARLQRLERLQPWIGGIGGLYVLQARKQTLPLSVARSNWRRQRTGIAVGSFARTGEQAARRDSSAKED
jgi:SAM-dependent methyltransferase